ncbi:MAG: DUF3168 domain-containing protein [Henriciella sp.]|nr:DUF3168 domain-containing protein [Henriciella sp.]
MSADGFLAGSDADLLRAVLLALRSDSDVQAVLGAPARIYDDETQGAAFPYAILERHEREPADGSEFCGAEHRLRFATYSRFGGRTEAREILCALRSAIDRLQLDLVGQRIVLAHVTYSDAMRARDRRSFRGVLRARIITETV